MKRTIDQCNILFCGTGGQGVLKASEVCGVAAMLSGYHVRKSEVHGMAQRGGSVESHLRFGRSVESPLIKPGQADFLPDMILDEAQLQAIAIPDQGAGLGVARIAVENLGRQVKRVRVPSQVQAALLIFPTAANGAVVIPVHLQGAQVSPAG
jgi:Pyruvate/2-oxoacid:ferredoxin oxidoreductase gamma subunit